MIIIAQNIIEKQQSIAYHFAISRVIAVIFTYFESMGLLDHTQFYTTENK